MLRYEKIDVSEGIDVNKCNNVNKSKKCELCYYCYFVKNFPTCLCSCKNNTQKILRFES